MQPVLALQSDTRLVAMLNLADSRLPVGGHVHSGGLEEAIASGVVYDLATVRTFLVRRVRSSGLVAASIAAAVTDGHLDADSATAEYEARTPSAAARAASTAQGRGMARLARRVWPTADWGRYGPRPHLPVITGAVGALADLSGVQVATVVAYTTMTGSATAAQRLLALDPLDIAALGLELAPLCQEVAQTAATGLADLSDPLLDILAERHIRRDMPLFAS